MVGSCYRHCEGIFLRWRAAPGLFVPVNFATCMCRVRVEGALKILGGEIFSQENFVFCVLVTSLVTCLNASQ